MTTPEDEVDPPTVARHLSPRARTSLGADQRAGDGADEPTVVLRPSEASRPDMPGATGAGSLQSAARIVQQLDVAPERTIVRAAAPLLLIVAQLRNSIERADVSALRRQVAEEIDRFQQLAQKLGVEAGDIIAARYVLCSTIDETVLMTPWGSRSEWSSNSLLNQYHNETWGGEKVFTILDRIKGNAEKKLPLLMLIHACLMLGFEGRYRVLERGRDQLDDLRTDLSRLIKRHTKTRADAPLSGTTRGERKGRRLNAFLPLWVVGVAAVALLLVIRVYADFTLSGAVRPAITHIQSLTAG